MRWETEKMRQKKYIRFFKNFKISLLMFWYYNYFIARFSDLLEAKPSSNKSENRAIK